MHRLAMVLASFMLAIGLFAWSVPAAVVTAQDGGYAPDDQEALFVDLINQYRGSLGLGPLSLNYQLGAAADYHSVDMATNNYFDHYLFDGTDPGTNIRNFGYSALPYGENIAAGMESAQDVLIAWQNSPGHDAEMRNPNFTEIGVGRAYGEGTYYGWYWTADFGGGSGGSAPVETAPVETLNANPEPDPIISPEDTTLSGSVTTEGSTTTYQEPATVTTDGNVVELPQNAVNADGDSATATGANPVADGTGETVIYGDINTGGVIGESIVYEEPSLNVSGAAPAPVETTYTAPVAAPVSTASEPIITDPTFSETTTTNISMEDGNGRAIGN